MFSWLGIVGLLVGPAGADGQLSGFSAEASSRQHRMEAALLELPDAETFRSHLERITREAHVSGTPANARVADYIAEQMTAAGIYIPDTAKEKPQEGVVVAIGPGRLSDDGTRVPMEVEVGDIVIYSKYAGTEYKEGEVEYLVLREDDILFKK